jgi:phage baseplate assembly protein W
MNGAVPVGILLPCTRGNDGYFKQTYSDIVRAHSNLKMLLLTSKGERPMMPTYGSDLRFLLFNPGEDEYDELFEDAIIEATERWMPEVSIQDVQIDRELSEQPNSAVFTIFFSIQSIPDSNEKITLEVTQ